MATGPYSNLFTTYPNAESWSAADPEEMGLVLLRDLKSHSPFNLSAYNMVALIRDHYRQEFGNQDAANRRLAVLLEAYQWLRNAGLIVPSPNEPQNF
jgi:hypothetical protein